MKRMSYSALATLMTLALLAIAWVPAGLWEPERGQMALLIALGLGLGGALLGDAIRGLVSRRMEGVEGLGQAALAGMSARMFATLIGVVVVLLLGRFATIQFGVWLGLHYVLLLGLEVFVSVRELRQNPAGSSGGEPPLEADDRGANAEDQPPHPGADAQEG